jgi:hypothetical protein
MPVQERKKGKTMINDKPADRPGMARYRVLARLSGMAGIAVYLVFLLVYAWPQMLSEGNGMDSIYVTLPGFLAIGYLFAWFREYEGGIILIFISSIAALSVFYQAHPPALTVMLPACGLLFASGLFFYLYHRGTKREPN